MAGLIQVGRQYQNDAVQGMDKVAKLENARQTAGDNLEAAEKSQKMMAVGTGAGIGMMAGMQAGSIGGPMGALAGAAVGYLAAEVF